MSIKTGFHLTKEKPLEAATGQFFDFVTLEFHQGQEEVVLFVRTMEQAATIQRAANELVRKVAEMTVDPMDLDDFIEAVEF